jgi:FtsX-like permease family protein
MSVDYVLHLKMHRRCEELALEFLSEGAVGEYLAARFPDSRIPAKLARLIHERTDGSPLFMVNVVDYLVAQKLVAQVDGKWEFKEEAEKTDLEAPEDIRQLIEKQVDGVISYGVDQRTYEIGIRLALGAQAGDVMKMVIWRGLSLALIGVALGLATAYALTRVIKNLLFDVSATDPATFALIAILLVVIALIASYIPAWRATKVDPLQALRQD